MPVTLSDLSNARLYAVQEHQYWKRQIIVNDNFGAGRWQVSWDDDTVDESDPLVENVYSGALVDKVTAAAQTLPALHTFATRGTRADRGERSAEKRQRIFQSYWTRSRIKKVAAALYYDWFHAGAFYTIPWANWIDRNGNLTAPAERFPVILRLDPRQAYPLTHDSLGNVTQILIARQRRLADLEQEYGKDHPSIAGIVNRVLGRRRDPRMLLEEIWYADQTQWGVALAESSLPQQYRHNPLIAATDYATLASSQAIAWLTDPMPHRLGNCPIVEAKRTTFDGNYRGAIEDVIPSLKVANNVMARLLDDMSMNIYAPVVLDNVENWDEWGPGAVLVGDGQGQANVIRDRPPVNFEAQRTIAQLIDQAHRQAFWPVQRSGDPDASIVSAKGVVALSGSFNNELATAQEDFAQGLQDVTQRVANLDEVHCPGTKRIDGVARNKPWSETYDPASDLNGDYRMTVSYGEDVGLDAQQALVRNATRLNLRTLSRRQFMERLGEDDPLQVERDIAIERLVDLYLDQVLPQQIAAGDQTAIASFIDRIDGDDATVRSAVLDAIKEARTLAAEQAGPGDGTQGIDPIQMLRSLGSGGIPGNAAGLPPVSPRLRSALPAATSRLAQEAAPGGTAT